MAADFDLGDSLGVEMMDLFVVRRRLEVVNTHGESTVTEAPDVEVWGVISPADDNSLARGEDEQHMGKGIQVATRFRLQGPTPGKQPDLVVYDGTTYIVKELIDLSRFGRGMTTAICQSIQLVDLPPAVEEI